jgi:thymidylate synthase (FAD)
LNYQTVEVVNYTQPAPNNKHKLLTIEDILVYTARVSNPANQENLDTGRKLLLHCIKNGHWSVFDQADITIEINTTRDIGRQILRHFSFRFQEFSQRYADVRKISGSFVTREARLQDNKNRQNSIELFDSDSLGNEWEKKQQAAHDLIQEIYGWALDNQIAKEQARVVLPEGGTMSRMYMKGSIRSWIHYCALRTYQGTQKEHIDVAQKCWNEVTNLVPSIKGVREYYHDIFDYMKKIGHLYLE